MTAIKVRFGDQYLVTPSGFAIEWIINRWRSGAELSRGQRSVIDLLLAGFCLLAIAGCASGPDLSDLRSSLASASEEIVSKQDESLSILKENTTALDAIKSQIDTLKASQAESETDSGIGGDLESEGTSPDENANDSHPVTPAVAESGDVPLFVCSTGSCAPCKRLWRDVDDGKLDGFEVNKAPPFDGLKSYPAIRFENPDSNTGWSVIYGYDEETRLWLRSKLLGENAVAANHVISTPYPMSQDDMIAMHNQLHGGGYHKWPGDLATHLETVHGVSTGGEPVSGSFFPVQRSTAIQSSRPVVRSNTRWQGFFGRSRIISR